MHRDLAIVVVGSGPWAQRHVAAIRTGRGLRLAGIVSRSLAAGVRETPADLQSVRVWPDLAPLLRETRPDGAILATEPGRQKVLCEQLIAAGVAILAEKPLTLSASEAGHVTARAAAAGVPLMVGLIHLFGNGYRTLRRSLAAVGTLRRIETVAGNQGPFRAYMPALWDYGPHDTGFALDLAGADPETVSASRLRGDATRHVVRLDLAFPGGLKAELTFGNLMDHRQRRLRCEGTGGTLVLEDAPAPRLTLNDAPVDIAGPLPLDNMLQAFAEAIRTGVDPLGTASLACRVNGVLEAASAALGIPVCAEEIEDG